jgi:hypothetical protein
MDKSPLNSSHHFDDASRYRFEDHQVPKSNQVESLKLMYARSLPELGISENTETLETTSNIELKLQLTQFLEFQSKWLSDYCKVELPKKVDATRIVLLPSEEFFSLMRRLGNQSGFISFAFYIPAMDMTFLNKGFPPSVLMSHLAHENGHQLSKKRLAMNPDTKDFVMQAGVDRTSTKVIDGNIEKHSQFQLINEAVTELLKVRSLYEFARNQGNSEDAIPIRHFLYDELIVVFDAIFEKLGFYKGDEEGMKEFVANAMSGKLKGVIELYWKFIRGEDQTQLEPIAPEVARFIISGTTGELSWQKRDGVKVSLEDVCQSLELNYHDLRSKADGLKNGKPTNFFGGKITVRKVFNEKGGRDPSMAFEL